jgi:hypothetical protein
LARPSTADESKFLSRGVCNASAFDARSWVVRSKIAKEGNLTLLYRDKIIVSRRVVVIVAYCSLSLLKAVGAALSKKLG